ncbi:hypothetical protein BLA50215_07910 [Burkholderia lata]|uniref:type III secretion system domain-containing protein n=1 Tax=Burkholderia lata (strain ATCC 17760 / DSM 23089 / LMG 22485 / NCIMB 9086 / R18194 / 383) TaxID=482957 RepID=UPI001453510C|nr:type III secretion system domain-containing protein [Burkholderia lata]VWD64761.1 hypothetical protein BLA50215_07910 [Burkholderia lata]
MSPALRRLYALWWQPGSEMAAGWWTTLGLAEWKQPYARQLLLRPALDRLIASRLGHHGIVPAMSRLADPLLTNDVRRNSLCLAMGLWALRCPDYLMLRLYREALSPLLDARALSQLQMVMPVCSTHAAELEPEVLLESALRTGAAWLSDSSDPALGLCRLLWEPANPSTCPAATPESVLQKLLRWL